MKIIKNNWFPFGNYKAFNFLGILFTKSDLSDKDINHEKIHCAQMKDCFYIFFILMLLIISIFNINFWWIFLSIFGFYIWYGIEYFIIRIFKIIDKQNMVYHEVSLEEEAYNYDDNLAYLNFRPHFAWVKYLNIDSYKK